MLELLKTTEEEEEREKRAGQEEVDLMFVRSHESMMREEGVDEREKSDNEERMKLDIFVDEREIGEDVDEERKQQSVLNVMGDDGWNVVFSIPSDPPEREMMVNPIVIPSNKSNCV
jgi:hypothetical protein